MLGRIDEIDCVEAQHRLNAPLGGAGQIAVDQVGLQIGLGKGDDDDDLIDVGDEHMFPAARGAFEHAVTGLDALDEPFIAVARSNPDAITRGDDVALVGRQALEQAAHGTAVLATVVGLHDVGEAVDAQHAPRQVNGGIDRRHAVGVATRGGAGVFLHDGALARQISLGADALGAAGRLFGKAVLREAAGPILVARRLGAVFAQLDADFFLFGHPGWFTVLPRREQANDGAPWDEPALQYTRRQNVRMPVFVRSKTWYIVVLLALLLFNAIYYI